MTGPEHYLAAERLLSEIDQRRNAPLDITSRRVGQAQVHAMLALAAATALGTGNQSWAEATGTDLPAAGHAAEHPAAGLPDAGLPDAGLPDAGLPDAGHP